MIKLALVVGLVLLSAYGIGLELFRRFQWSNDSYALPLGFATLLFGQQLLFYPIQYLNGDSRILHAISLGFICVGLTLWAVHIKHFIKQMFNIDLIWITVYLLGFFYVLYHSSISMPRSDSQMYLNYIAQNIDNPQVNLFNLWTGLTGKEFDTIYLFQGYYHFTGFINVAVNFFYQSLKIGQGISVIVTSVYGMGIFYAVLYATSILNFCREIKPKSTWSKILIYLVCFFYLGFFYYRVVFAFYGNTWRTLFITLMVFELYRWVKHRQSAHLFAATLFLGAAITASASSLFIGFALLYGFASYQFTHHEDVIFNKLGLLISPIVLYVLVMFKHDGKSIFGWLLLVTILFYGSLFVPGTKRMWKWFEGFLASISKWLFVAILPGMAVLLSFLVMKSNPAYLYDFNHFFQNHASYDMVQDYLFIYSDVPNAIMNVVRYVGIVLLFLTQRQKKETRFVLWLVVSVTLLFLNPWTTAFISKAMASNVYYRAYDAIFNPFTETLYLMVILDHLNRQWALKAGISLVLLFMISYLHEKSLLEPEQYTGYGFYIEEGKSVMPTEKIPYDEYLTIQAFKQKIAGQTPKSGQWTVISHADGLRTYVPEVYQIFTARQYWYEWDRVDENFYYAARRYYSWEEKLYPTTFPMACDFLIGYKVDYVLAETIDNHEFYTESLRCSEEVYTSYGFSLLKVR